MKSMTGYGKGECTYNNTVITVELKAVNHRFLDLSFKLPRVLSFAEESMRNIIKSIFTRGHIDVFVNFGAKSGDDSQIMVNEKLVEQYLSIAKEMSSKYGLINDLSVDKILTKTNVVMSGDVQLQEDVALQAIIDATKTACAGLVSMRATEGVNMKEILLSKIASINNAAKCIEEFVPKQIQDFKDKLVGRVSELLGEIPLDEQKLMNEIVFYTDKVSVDEEFTRLYAHCKHFVELSQSEEPSGRQLDFIVQEMNREANTIGSKCNDLCIANYVLQLKTDIEKVREQVQNIE